MVLLFVLGLLLIAVAIALLAMGLRPAEEARGFWAGSLGVALERSVQGEDAGAASAEAAVELVLNLYTEPDRPAADGGR